MSLDKVSFKDKLLYWIVVLLGCHQFPVFNIGGSFKTYDFLGFILMFYVLFESTKLGFIRKSSFYAFLFFIICPLVSYIYTSIFLDYPDGFYMRYASKPKIESFKYNYYLFPLLQILLLAMNYFVFVSLESSKSLYKNFDRLIKGIVTMGTIISVYSLFAITVVDFIPLLPSFIQFKRNYPNFRTVGFSQEPGTYVLYQAWVCLFLFYSKRLYTKTKWNILFVINVISFLLTQSSTLAGFFLIIGFGFFIFSGSAQKKVKIFVGIGLFILFVYAGTVFFNLQELIEGVLVKKIEHFLSGKSNTSTTTSGGTRAYTTGIGYRIFFDHPFLGVGQGRSIYYMYLYEFKMGIKHFGERLEPGTLPMGILSLVMAEEGTVGLIILFLFYFSVIWKFWNNRNKSTYHRMFLIGGMFVFVFFFTLFPVTHVFIWAYLALGLGYIKYYDRQLANINLAETADLVV